MYRDYWKERKKRGKLAVFIPSYLGNGERSKQQYPDPTSYCPSHGYDIKPNQIPVLCNNWKDYHNELATIDNKMSGVSTNCFHHKPWWCGKVNSNKLSQTKLNKTDLKIYIQSSSNKQYNLYEAAATALPSNSTSQLATLTSQLQTILKNKEITQVGGCTRDNIRYSQRSCLLLSFNFKINSTHRLKSRKSHNSLNAPLLAQRSITTHKLFSRNMVSYVTKHPQPQLWPTNQSYRHTQICIVGVPVCLLKAHQHQLFWNKCMSG